MLGCNKNGHKGATSLAQVPGQCLSLAVLDLQNNDIKAGGATSLGGVLWQCSSLEHLFVGGFDFGCDVGDDGATIPGTGACAVLVPQDADSCRQRNPGDEPGGGAAKVLLPLRTESQGPCDRTCSGDEFAEAAWAKRVARDAASWPQQPHGLRGCPCLRAWA